MIGRTEASPIPCLACGSQEISREVKESRAFGATLPIDHCRRCGAHFIGAPVDTDTLYEGSYWDGHARGVRRTWFSELYDRASHRWIARSHFHFLRRQRQRSAADGSGGSATLRGLRLLDVGCGRGENICFLEARGLACDGVEPDAVFAAEAATRLRRGQVHVGGIESLDDDAQLADSRYDIVCAFHVLEHVTDPVVFLRLLAARLAPGGGVYLEVPNCEHPAILRDSVERHPHLLHPTVAALAALLERADFQVEAIGAYRQVIDPREPSRLRKWRALPRLLWRGDYCEATADVPTGEHIRLWARPRSDDRSTAPGELEYDPKNDIVQDEGGGVGQD